MQPGGLSKQGPLGVMAMRELGLGKPLVLWSIVGGVVVLGGAVWVFVGGATKDSANPLHLPENLTTAALKKKAAEDPVAVGRTIMSTFDRDDLTAEQRRAVRRSAREVFMSQIDKRVDEYFAASEDEKLAVLDRQIDEWQARSAKMQEMWAERRRQREARRKENGDDSPQDRRGRFGGQNREERKARSENRDPDKGARRMAYFQAARSRASERGIQMPGGRGGPGRGNRGGGRGGARGGRGS